MLERPTRTAHEQSEFARARAAEKLRHTVENRKAARIVANQALDAQDCMRLLSMLGLEPADEDMDGPGRPYA